MRRVIPLLIAFFVLTAPAEAAWIWPVSGEVITPYRNGTDPYATGQHRGIDIAAPVGTPVVAAAAGDVRFAGTAGSSGLTISIRTGDGYDTSYLHLSSTSVRAGARVSTGDRIGAVGTTGVRSATAPHLHFGVRDAGTRHDYHDPLAFLPPPPPPARTPDPPPPAPAPAPSPVPPAAAPMTAPRPGPRATPAPRAIPGPAPAPRAHPAPAAHPTPHRAPVHHAHPVPQLHSTPQKEPASHPAPHKARAHRAPLGRLVPASHAPLGGTRRPGSAVPVRKSAGDSPGGADIGWIAACAGLLLAAGLLGMTGNRATWTSKRVRALISPLVARR